MQLKPTHNSQISIYPLWISNFLSFIFNTTVLMTIFDDVRIQGYAANHGEMAPELLSVAAPVRNIDGEVVAALNMAVNADHYDRSAVKTTLIPAVISFAERISKALGYHQ